MTSGYDIIIFPGQSNTVGHGMGPHPDAPSNKDSQIFQIGRRDGLDMTIIPATFPLHFWGKTDAYALTSYCLSLARYYAAEFLANDRNLLLIPAAEDATSILQWLGIIAGSGDPLYSDMIARVNLALSQPGTNRIVGWFEHQGEADVGIAAGNSNPQNQALEPDAAAYLSYKLQFIDKVRGDIGTFPMFFGLFPDNWTAFNSTKLAFEAAMRTIPSLRSSCYIVDSAGLPGNETVNSGDPIHFNSASQEILALRHFEAYRAMFQPRRIMTGVLP